VGNSFQKSVAEQCFDVKQVFIVMNLTVVVFRKKFLTQA